ncbi:hypothetical protein NMG60_11032887 [Bertholletia excelsa]
MEGGSARFIIGVIGRSSVEMITFKRIIRNKSTENFSGIPYALTLLSCLLSAWYGLPFVTPHNLLVVITSGVGAITESIYIVVFIIFAPRKEKCKILALLACVVTLFGVDAIVSIFVFAGPRRKLFCGFAFTIVCVIMYASPLSVMRMVIKTKSVEFMPFFLSLSIFLSGTCWFIYGILGKDPFITVPNALGSSLGAIQLILYAIYRERKGDREKADANPWLETELGKHHPEKQSHV